MFCYQCQEAAKNTGCAGARGVCGKTGETANLQDLLVFVLKGIALYGEQAVKTDLPLDGEGAFVARALFATITNANFDDDRMLDLVREALNVRDRLAQRLAAAKTAETAEYDAPQHEAATWSASNAETMRVKARQVGVLSTEDEDTRSLREFLIYGLKGIAAYAEHAAVLGCRDPEIYAFFMEALAATAKELDEGALAALLRKCGAVGVQTMALLDRANTEAFGNPSITKVRTGVRSNPGILISGHDLKDLEELLEQTRGTGIDVYTHCEMLPAHAYPVFAAYEHLAGNYGSSWWRQGVEFEAFNGPILMTTNCITPTGPSYAGRLFTTGVAGFPGCQHIPDRRDGQPKDFSPLIEMARTCPPPRELEDGEITAGFAHHQVMQLADKILAAVQAGHIKRLIVMAGCDGRQKAREYYTEVARALPEDAVILTAGCAKYRYNKLDLGSIDGIPRVLDSGQCNDSYSWAFVALKLKDALGLDDVNDLPISYDVAWYEQKAVIVLLALLSLGVKGIRVGPTLPAFVSPSVAEFLVREFGIQPMGDVKEDIAAMMAGA